MGNPEMGIYLPNRESKNDEDETKKVFANETTTEESHRAGTENQEASEFDAEQHMIRLREQIEIALDGPKVDQFFAELHPNDIKKLKRALMSELDNPIHRHFAELLTSVIPNKESLTRGGQEHEKSELRDMFFGLSGDFSSMLENDLGQSGILGTEAMDSELVVKRSADLIEAQRRAYGGKSPIRDFAINLVMKSAKGIRR